MKKMKKSTIWILLIILALVCIGFFVFPEIFSSKVSYKMGEEVAKAQEPTIPAISPIDPVAYDAKMLELANNPPPKGPTTKVVINKKTGVKTTITIPPKPVAPNIWPVKTVYPNAGAILPFHRIIAYYGNFYSKSMGILGAYPSDEILTKLNAEVQKWNEADPSTPAIPAIHYIAVVAQGGAGADGKYRSRMPFTEIDKAITLAQKANAIVFLDVQVGFSNLQTELPLLEKYLKMPNVHLGIDPEFSMKNGIRPGKEVGTLDATDINFAVDYLAKIVKDNNLTPKILIVHRYNEKMVTNYKAIKTVPDVQVVMDMDGWGIRDHKLTTYHDFIYKQPVQFTGFKIFYKNDTLTKGNTIMTPEEVLKLHPRPIYIQYQ